MIVELELVAKTDPKSVYKTLESEWLFSQCDQLCNPSHRGQLVGVAWTHTAFN